MSLRRIWRSAWLACGRNGSESDSSISTEKGADWDRRQSQVCTGLGRVFGNIIPELEIAPLKQRVMADRNAAELVISLRRDVLLEFDSDPFRH